MSFMDKVKTGFDKAKEGLSDFAETTKIKLEINRLESRRSDLFGEIGKRVYALHGQGRAIADVEAPCKEIDGLEQQIKQKNEEIARINAEAHA
jgi:hypothetical protein